MIKLLILVRASLFKLRRTFFALQASYGCAMRSLQSEEWWRWGELNSRPLERHYSFYIYSLLSNLTIRLSQQTSGRIASHGVFSLNFPGTRKSNQPASRRSILLTGIGGRTLPSYFYAASANCVSAFMCFNG